MRKKLLMVSIFWGIWIMPSSSYGQTSMGSWSQWRGPERNGISNETGLLKSWPVDGPPVLWKKSGLGKGFSSVVFGSGKIVTLGDRGEGQYVIALDGESREEVWASRIGDPWSDGSRCTPTIDGDKVYAISAHGVIVCLQLSDGKEIWHKNFGTDFGGKMMSGWGFSESPLVDGGKVICTPGGKDATIVALDKNTGDTIWVCGIPDLGSRGKEGAGYSSNIAAEFAGVRQYVQLLGTGLVGIAAVNGEYLWGYNKIANNVANITTPVVQEPYVFCSTAYKTGSALLKISPAEGSWKTEEVYFLDSLVFQNHHGGVVLVDHHIYGGHGQNAGDLVCIELETGKICWKEKALGKGSAAVIYADQHLYFLYEDGRMALIEATPSRFNVKGTFMIPEESGPKWAHPVILDKKLYIRVHDVIFCFDIGIKE
jgi:outer membrane protein assembly factor BamB